MRAVFPRRAPERAAAGRAFFLRGKPRPRFAEKPADGGRNRINKKRGRRPPLTGRRNAAARDEDEKGAFRLLLKTEN